MNSRKVFFRGSHDYKFESISHQQVWCLCSLDNAVEAVAMVPETQTTHLLRTPWQAHRQWYTTGDVCVCVNEYGFLLVDVSYSSEV